MKKNKLKIITMILAIVAICLVSFVGVYGQNMNQMQNKVKDYNYTKDLKGYRELIFEVSTATEVLDSEGNLVGSTDNYTDQIIENNSYQKTDTKINSEESLNTQNYQKAKSIIEKRLKSLGVEEYNIGLDTQNGTIYLQIPENSSTDHIASNILQVSNFEIKDSEDQTKVFITNDDIKSATAAYNTTTTGTTVYLQIELNKNGKETLKELSIGDYATKEETENTQNSETSNETEQENTTTEETNSQNTEANVTENQNATSNETESNEATSEETSQKSIILSIDDNDLITASFDTPIENGIIDLSMSQESTDSESISDTLQSTSTIALLLNSGKMPLTYKISQNSYISTDITLDVIQKIIYVIAIIVIISLILITIKYKLKGLLASIAFIGFVATDLLLIRYTNVLISLESIVAAIIVLAINYIMTYKLLKANKGNLEQNNTKYIDELKLEITKLLPIFMISIVFVFVKYTQIYTFGMFVFWGILLSLIYNYIITKNILD